MLCLALGCSVLGRSACSRVLQLELLLAHVKGVRLGLVLFLRAHPSGPQCSLLQHPNALCRAGLILSDSANLDAA